MHAADIVNDESADIIVVVVVVVVVVDGGSLSRVPTSYYMLVFYWIVLWSWSCLGRRAPAIRLVVMVDGRRSISIELYRLSMR